MRAARMLNDAVEKYLHQSVPGARNLRIVVRIYADLTTLSKQLARAKLTGLEKRSFGAFSAAFTRAISSFDFVDALDEEGTKFKIRGMTSVAISVYRRLLTDIQSSSRLLPRIALAVIFYMLRAMTVPISPNSCRIKAKPRRLLSFRAPIGILSSISPT